MSNKDGFIMETVEPSNQLQLRELYYNCSECSSPIEIISINEGFIEFKCINNNKKIKISIKDYLDEMILFNDKNIHKNECIHNNKNYECFCLNCNKYN